MEKHNEELNDIQLKIIEILKENGEMRFGKLSKILIHSGVVKSSFIVEKTLKRGCRLYKDFEGEELFITPKTGYWKLVD